MNSVVSFLFAGRSPVAKQPPMEPCVEGAVFLPVLCVARLAGVGEGGGGALQWGWVAVAHCVVAEPGG